MAEYGFTPQNQDDNKLKSTLITGGLAAVGLFALGTGFKGWAKKTLHGELERGYRAAYEAIEGLYPSHPLNSDKTSGRWILEKGEKIWQEAEPLQLENNPLNISAHEANERVVAHLEKEYATDKIDVGPMQALGLAASRSRGMEYWTKFAKTNTIARLVDDLAFVRLVREQYGMRSDLEINRLRYRYMGRLGDLSGVTDNNLKDFNPESHAFFSNGKLYAINKEDKVATLPGKFMLFGRASAGDERSIIEKAGDELLEGKHKRNNQLVRSEAYNKKSILNILWNKEKGKTFESFDKFQEKFDWSKYNPKAHTFDNRGTRERFQELNDNLTGVQRALSAAGISENTAKNNSTISKVKRYFDLGQNEYGTYLWTGAARRKFREQLFGILSPADRPITRELAPHSYDVIQSLELNAKGIKDMFLGGGGKRDINVGTVMAYHLMRRINTTVAWNGIAPWMALSPTSTTFKVWGQSKEINGPAAYAANIVFKRALPLYAAGFYAGYLNSAIGDHTGERPTDRIRDARANLDLWIAGEKDKRGITPFVKHVNDLSGGALGYIAHPFVESPVGLSKEELRDYQEHGSVGVRKGRFWSFGSSTPFRGERIQYFTPTYKQYANAGDVYNTDTLMGSAKEFYANAALPTPGHPFAPIKHFFTDRYHYEEKHYRDRPYPLTSPFMESTTPWGAVLNPTIGQILKPTRVMHEQDLPYLITGPHKGEPNPKYRHRGEIRSINEQIKAVAASKETVGFVTPGGSIESMEIIPLPTRDSQVGKLGEINDGIMEDAENMEAGYDEGVPIGSYGLGARAIAPYGSGKQKNRVKIAELNAQEKAGRAKRFTKERMLQPARTPGLYPVEDPNSPTARRRLISSNDPRYLAGLGYYSLTELSGIYGFGAVTMTGDMYANLPTVANAGTMTGFERTYWDRWNSGGMLPTPGLSEAARRFMPHRYRTNSTYNPIRNNMPTWLPGTEGPEPGYFLDFLHGDPYTLLPNGETRLPGASYEKLHGLASSPVGHPGANYDDITKLSILADVAPWSTQYRYYRDYLTHDESLSDEDHARLQLIKKQTTLRKKRYNMTPYRAKYSDLKYENVTVKDIIDNNTFTTVEHPDNPIRLAGVHVSIDRDAPVTVGEKLRIGYSADPTQQIAHDTLHTIRSVVFRGDYNINRGLIAIGNRATDEKGPAGTHVKYSEKEIHYAKFIEGLAHAPIPYLHNKFMPIDSPLELYKRTQVYGKDWQSWQHPFRDYLFPAMESFAQNGIAGLGGAAFLGWSLGNKNWKIAAGFAAVDAILSVTNKDKIPSYRENERDINEYFDILKYMKYQGLYDKTREWIKQHEHHDIGQIADRYKMEGDKRKRKIQILKAEKRKLIVSGQKVIAAERIKEINAEIRDLQAYRAELPLSRNDVLALEYKNMAQTTLYGAEPGGDMRRVLLALSSKEREFFTAFLKAPGAERGEILKLMPKNERRFLEANWHMNVESRPELNSYFKHHFLPGADWRGWHADSSLDDYKLVVMKQEGLDLTSHGFWPQDEERVREERITDLRPRRKTPGEVREQIHSVLAGYGLTDIDINLMPTSTPNHKMELQIHHNRKDDISRSQVGV